MCATPEHLRGVSCVGAIQIYVTFTTEIQTHTHTTVLTSILRLACVVSWLLPVTYRVLVRSFSGWSLYWHQPAEHTLVFTFSASSVTPEGETPFCNQLCDAGALSNQVIFIILNSIWQRKHQRMGHVLRHDGLCMKLLKPAWEVNQQEGEEEFKYYMVL